MLFDLDLPDCWYKFNVPKNTWVARGFLQHASWLYCMCVARCSALRLAYLGELRRQQQPALLLSYSASASPLQTERSESAMTSNGRLTSIQENQKNLGARYQNISYLKRRFQRIEKSFYLMNKKLFLILPFYDDFSS